MLFGIRICNQNFKIRRNISPFGEDTRRASMRNTNFKKYAGLFRHPPNVTNRIRLRRATSNARVFNKISYAGLFRHPPNVANWIRLRRATSNAHVFNKISYAGLSKWSQRGGLENRLPNRHGGSNPSSCAKNEAPILAVGVFLFFVLNLCAVTTGEERKTVDNCFSRTKSTKQREMKQGYALSTS